MFYLITAFAIFMRHGYGSCFVVLCYAICCVLVLPCCERLGLGVGMKFLLNLLFSSFFYSFSSRRIFIVCASCLVYCDFYQFNESWRRWRAVLPTEKLHTASLLTAQFRNINLRHFNNNLN